SEMLGLLKSEYGVTHGYANGITLQYRSQGESAADEDLVEAQYSGPKAALRPTYEALLSAASQFGDDVQISPKKASVSLRRSKQFALIEPASATRIQLGINLRGAEATDRLRPATGMCTHKVSLCSPAEVDAELLGWLRAAYDAA
ncbi:MAG: DUF5655 domain-containing protein, partial [Microbacterium pygmaeum]